MRIKSMAEGKNDYNYVGGSLTDRKQIAILISCYYTSKHIETKGKYSL